MLSRLKTPLTYSMELCTDVKWPSTKNTGELTISQSSTKALRHVVWHEKTGSATGTRGDGRTIRLC